MARTKRPNPFLENPPCASTSEEDAEKRGRGGAEDESDSDSDGVLKKFHKGGADFDSDKLPKKPKSKPKSKPNVEPPEPKKFNAERVWSEKDEIAVLEGLKDWKNKGKTWNKEKGWIPVNALGEFLNGIKESLHFFPDTKMQLYPKIQKLKIRYFNAMKNKYTDGDEDPVFEKPHDIRLFLISKDIWSDLYKNMKEMEEKTGKNAAGGNVEVGDGNGSNVEAKWGELFANLPMSANLPKFGMKECLSKEGLKLIGDSKVKKFEKKWKKLHEEELDMNLKRLKLMRETIEAVLGAVKASKD